MVMEKDHSLLLNSTLWSLHKFWTSHFSLALSQLMTAMWPPPQVVWNMFLLIINVLLHCCNIIWIYTCLNVPVVWLYPIQLCAKLILAKCFSNFCMSMQRHPCILEEVSLAPIPSLGVTKHSPSPSMVPL